MEYRSEYRSRRQPMMSARWSSFSCHKVVCAFLSALLLFAAQSFAVEARKPLKILMLFNGDKDSPAFSRFQTGLRSKIEQQLDAPVWIYEESFDEGWLEHSSSSERTIEAFLQSKYAKRGIDIVVPVGDYPVEYMQKRRKTLLPDAQLIYVLLGHSPQPPILNATGMVWRLDLAPTLEIALNQNPGTRHVLLITGATVVDGTVAQFFLGSAVKYLQEKHNDVDVQILSRKTLEETRSALASLPQDTITVLVTYYGDSAGQGFVPARILPSLSAATNRPMYGWIDTYLGRGIVGGSIVDLDRTGAEFGELVLRAWRAGKAGTIPEIANGPSQNMFDWQQMKRWGIGMDKVPPASRVINREYTPWELNKWRIIVLVVLVAIEAMLILALVRLIAGQKRNLTQLARQREREAVIAEFAAAFINVPPELVSREIAGSFHRLLEFFDLDRVSMFDFSSETPRLRLLSVRPTTGINEPPPVVDLAQLSRTSSQVLRSRPMVISHLDQLAVDVSELKDYLSARGVRSFVTFPLQHSGATFTVLSFSTVRKEREWEPDLMQSLQTIADIFGSALERKHAETAERESGNRLTGIVESAMDAIIAVDGQQRIVVFNATAEKMFGCSTEEALGQPIDRFIPHRFRLRHGEHIRRFAAAGDTNRVMGALGDLGTLRALRANGKEFPIEASISQVRTDAGSLFTVIIRDITEREQSEHALRESEGRFRLVANTAPVLIWMSGPDNLCNYFNQPWLDFTGRRLEDELGNGWTAGVHPDDLEKCLETYKQAFNQRQTFRMQYRLRGHDGSFRWLLDIGVPRVNADGSFAGYIGSCVDVNERVVAEQQLNRSHELNASILESLRNHLAVLDPNGVIVAATKQGPRFTETDGISRLNLSVGANYFDICKTAAEAGDRNIAAALAGVQEIYEGKRNHFELEYDYKSGADQRWFLMSVTLLKTTHGGVVISRQEITEQKRHEQAIQELNRRLIDAQEEERSRIARELHDDINQQIALLAVELQQLEGSLPEDLTDSRQRVRVLWKKTHELSTDIQQLSHRLHSTKLQHLGIVAAMRGLCDEFSEQHKIAADFQFRKVPAGMDPGIALSLFRIAQESLHNVAKHSLAKKVRMELLGIGTNIVMRVSDDGVGFDPDAPAHRRGLGMVSMSERIRSVGGTLTVTSRHSLGTQIEVAIPLPSQERISEPSYAARKTG